MKVKELIAELNKLDPTGETHVEGLWYVDMVEAYWDGTCLRTIGPNTVEYNNEGYKVRIHKIDVLDALEAGFEIQLNVNNEHTKARLLEYVLQQKEMLERIQMEVTGKISEHNGVIK